MSEVVDDGQGRSSRPWWALLATLGVVGLGLFLFDWFSASSTLARRGLISQRPPVYGRFEPSFSRLGAYALALVAVAGIGAFVLARGSRIRATVLIPVAASFLLSFSAAVVMVNGDAKNYVAPILRVKTADYQVDVPLVRKYGVRNFVRHYPDIAPNFTSVHSKTHPPGPVVFFSYLQRLFPRHVVPRAIVIAALASLVLIPTWFIARRVAGERAALYAVLLLAVAPSPVIFAFTNMDAVYATILATVAALFVWALDAEERRPRLAFLAGVAAALASFMTYAVVFVLVAMALFALLKRGFRESVERLAIAAAGTVAGLLLLRLVLGFDLLASYHASYRLLPDDNSRSYLYWVFGNPAVWLTFAGLPLAAFGLRELVLERPRYLIALFLPLLIADLTRIFPAETERIGQFAYPFLAAAAGAALVRWEESSGRKRPGVIAFLVMFAALQAIALEALYFTYW